MVCNARPLNAHRATVGSWWVAVYTVETKVGQVHLKVSKSISGHHNLMLSKQFQKPANSVSPKLPCLIVPSCGVSSPVVAGLKALQSRRWREIEETQPATDRRLFPGPLSFVCTLRALRYRPLGSRTYSSLSRENLSNKLWPSSSRVAGAAILPYARWFTEICGWGYVWRHVRAWASTRGESRFLCWDFRTGNFSEEFSWRMLSKIGLSSSKLLKRPSLTH